jgi:hypothetical protein
MRHPAPAKLDETLATPRNKPLSKEPDPTAGPTAVPGEYQVELEVGSEKQVASFTIVKDPRLATTPEAYRQQFALLQELMDSLGKLNGAVNRFRRIKRQLAALADRLGDSHTDLAGKAKAIAEPLAEVERVLVDVHRESARDTLRNPAGLNDTLIDLINTVAISDNAPTVPATAVSRELMTRVDQELARLDALVATELAEFNRLAAAQAIDLVGG